MFARPGMSKLSSTPGIAGFTGPAGKVWRAAPVVGHRPVEGQTSCPSSRAQAGGGGKLAAHSQLGRLHAHQNTKLFLDIFLFKPIFQLFQLCHPRAFFSPVKSHTNTHLWHLWSHMGVRVLPKGSIITFQMSGLTNVCIFIVL